MDSVTESVTVQTYALYDGLRHWIKIGRSTHVTKRMASLRAASGADLRLLGVIDEDCESELHAALRPFRLRGEWFEVTDHVRRVVSKRFGCAVPDEPGVQEARVRAGLDALEREWGIPLEPPTFEWFTALTDWLADACDLGDSDDAVLGLVLHDRWPKWIAAVGGDPGDGSLALVIADRPTPAGFDDYLSELFWTVDGYTTFKVGVASDPPRDIVETLLGAAA